MSLTPEQISKALFKKNLAGKPSSKDSRQFFEEAGSARPSITVDQVWAESHLIPDTAPPSDEGVVQVITDLPLNPIPGAEDAFTHPDLKDIIPFNWGDGTSYNYTIKDSAGEVIPFGLNDWFFDPDAGVLTFYQGAPGNMPPTMSCWKYVGRKGVGSSEAGPGGSTVGYASVSRAGIVKMSYPSAGSQPVAVADTDPRMHNTRVPRPHADVHWRDEVNPDTGLPYATDRIPDGTTEHAGLISPAQVEGINEANTPPYHLDKKLSGMFVNELFDGTELAAEATELDLSAYANANGWQPTTTPETKKGVIVAPHALSKIYLFTPDGDPAITHDSNSLFARIAYTAPVLDENETVVTPAVWKLKYYYQDPVEGELPYTWPASPLVPHHAKLPRVFDLWDRPVFDPTLAAPGPVPSTVPLADTMTPGLATVGGESLAGHAAAPNTHVFEDAETAHGGLLGKITVNGDEGASGTVNLVAGEGMKLERTGKDIKFSATATGGTVGQTSPDLAANGYTVYDPDKKKPFTDTVNPAAKFGTVYLSTAPKSAAAPIALSDTDPTVHRAFQDASAYDEKRFSAQAFEVRNSGEDPYKTEWILGLPESTLMNLNGVLMRKQGGVWSSLVTPHAERHLPGGDDVIMGATRSTHGLMHPDFVKLVHRREDPKPLQDKLKALPVFGGYKREIQGLGFEVTKYMQNSFPSYSTMEEGVVTFDPFNRVKLVDEATGDILKNAENVEVYGRMTTDGPHFPTVVLGGNGLALSNILVKEKAASRVRSGTFRICAEMQYRVYRSGYATTGVKAIRMNPAVNVEPGKYTLTVSYSEGMGYSFNVSGPGGSWIHGFAPMGWNGGGTVSLFYQVSLGGPNGIETVYPIHLDLNIAQPDTAIPMIETFTIERNVRYSYRISENKAIPNSINSQWVDHKVVSLDWQDHLPGEVITIDGGLGLGEVTFTVPMTLPDRHYSPNAINVPGDIRPKAFVTLSVTEAQKPKWFLDFFTTLATPEVVSVDGTAIATDNDTEAGQAFDGDDLTFWTPDPGTGFVVGKAIGYDFGTTLDELETIVDVKHRVSDIEFKQDFDPEFCVSQVAVECSDDNLVWTQLATFQVSFGGNPLQLMFAPAARYWRVVALGDTPDTISPWKVLGLTLMSKGEIPYDIPAPGKALTWYPQEIYNLHNMPMFDPAAVIPAGVAMAGLEDASATKKGVAYVGGVGTEANRAAHVSHTTEPAEDAHGGAVSRLNGMKGPVTLGLVTDSYMTQTVDPATGTVKYGAQPGVYRDQTLEMTASLKGLPNVILTPNAMPTTGIKAGALHVDNVGQVWVNRNGLSTGWVLVGGDPSLELFTVGGTQALQVGHTVVLRTDGKIALSATNDPAGDSKAIGVVFKMEPATATSASPGEQVWVKVDGVMRGVPIDNTAMPGDYLVAKAGIGGKLFSVGANPTPFVVARAISPSSAGRVDVVIVRISAGVGAGGTRIIDEWDAESGSFADNVATWPRAAETGGNYRYWLSGSVIEASGVVVVAANVRQPQSKYEFGQDMEPASPNYQRWYVDLKFPLKTADDTLFIEYFRQ